MPGNVTGIIYEAGGQRLLVKFAKASIASATTDGAVISAVASRKIRVLGFALSPAATTTACTFNSKPGGAGTAISATFTILANTGFACPPNAMGYFETVSGEGLTMTTGTGGTVGVQVVYVEVP